MPPGLRLIDSYVPALVEALGPDDLLFFSADHGNDPTDGSTDHTREYVPLLVAGMNAAGVNLGIRAQYCDVAATIAEGLGLPMPERGEVVPPGRFVNAVELIQRKRDRGVLTDEEIAWLIQSYTSGAVPDYQMAAMAMAIFLNGLEPAELVEWTRAMLHSGEVLDFSDITAAQGRQTLDRRSR